MLTNIFLYNFRVIKTHETEEFAYISSVEIDSPSRNLSISSSFDRVTVINRDKTLIDTLQKVKDKLLKEQTFSKINTNEKGSIRPICNQPNGLNNRNKKEKLSNFLDCNSNNKQKSIKYQNEEKNNFSLKKQSTNKEMHNIKIHDTNYKTECLTGDRSISTNSITSESKDLRSK